MNRADERERDREPQAPLLQTLALRSAHCRRFGGFVLATLLGAAAVAAAIGLIATSAWLISRSAQRPQESAVAIAIVGVQFLRALAWTAAVTPSGWWVTTPHSAC